ncbi:MAG: citrate lyase holo-[acyl-carrier protein] synthase [Candidatus Izemoplasma sp.]|nr:citrate lyase holo-[acyl-carrier protein] synthase [Candidatus Izemoplasma sp.]
MDILSAREARSHHIQRVMTAFPNKTCVVLKLNMVGPDKNPKAFQWIITYYHIQLQTQFNSHIIRHSYHESVDGNYFLYIVKRDPKLVKDHMVALEDDSALGRLIDIDVYHQHPLTRKRPRQCIICDDLAHHCVRSQAHSVEDVRSIMTSIMHNALTAYMTHITIESMIEEVNLYPCFGLVSNKDAGCHKDMNSDTFLASIRALKPFIKAYLEEDDSKKLKAIGLNAEKAMFEATEGINTHKGLIFLLGIFLPVLKQAIVSGHSIAHFHNNLTTLANSIVGDYYNNLKLPQTAGDRSYIDYQTKGVRGIALDGFDVVLNQPPFNTDYDRLLYFMANIDDTTIIHKTSYETLKRVKKEIKALIEQGGYPHNHARYNALSNTYKKAGISPGGSADLWVISRLFETFKPYLKREHI